METILDKISKFKETFGGVMATTENDFTKSKYANLEDIVTSIKEPLEEVKLRYVQWPDIILPEGIQVLKTKLWSPDCEDTLESTMNIKDMCPKNDAQKVGSSLTYSRRYSLCIMLDILTFDDDGNMSAHDATRKASEKQLNQIGTLMNDTNTTDSAIENYISKQNWGSTLDDIGNKQAVSIINNLKRKLSKQKKSKREI